MTQSFYDPRVREKVETLFRKPLMELVREASAIHMAYWHSSEKEEMQKSQLLSIKTGGCQENCGYCSQSRHYKTGLPSTPPVSLDEIKQHIQNARQSGATRFCMGAAWKRIPPALMPYLKQAIQLVKESQLEACVTLGSLTLEQARELKEAGCDYYNHNIDTSPRYYPQVVTTRTFAERMETLQYVRKAGMKVCCGGIIGMGETPEDHIEFLSVLASLNPHPESVPINQLVPIPGTPLANSPRPKTSDLVRVIACARILMPESRIRLAAGRKELSQEVQILCFLAGANSLFVGDRLLTTPLPGVSTDTDMLDQWFGDSHSDNVSEHSRTERGVDVFSSTR